jgi:3-hydroxyisobutyrate dehydrogenase-like beta-hydroxyacid dehydrogenase
VNQSDAPRDLWSFLGFGEAAAAIVAAGFPSSARAIVLLPADRPPSDATRRRLAASGLPSSSDPAAARDARVVLSLVTPDAAVDAAGTVAPYLRRGAIYVDFNSIAGGTAAEIAAVVDGHGARFVDAAVMGPVPLMKLDVPIWVSGTAAEEFHRLATAQGLATTVLSARPGDASSLKMLWSVMTKGTIALLAEALVGAHRLGLLQPILSFLADEYGNTGTPTMILRMLRSTAASGTRRAGEMREAKRTLEAVDVPTWTVDSTIRWITALTGMRDAAAAESATEVVRAVSDTLGQASPAATPRASRT